MSCLFILLCLLWDVNKKVTKNSSAKKGKRRCEAAFFKDTSNFSVCSTWSPWLKGLVLSETCGKEKGKNSSSTLRQRWIEYVSLKPSCPVCWIVFFLCTVWTISWRSINNMKTKNCQKQGTLNFIRVMTPLRKTFHLEKCCWVLLSRCQTMKRMYMFAMKKRRRVGLCWRA